MNESIASPTCYNVPTIDAELLALLTPQEREELDRLLTAPVPVSELLAVIPLSVRRLMLDSMEQIKERERGVNRLYFVNELDLREEIKAKITAAIETGEWPDPVEPRRCALVEITAQVPADPAKGQQPAETASAPTTTEREAPRPSSSSSQPPTSSPKPAARQHGDVFGVPEHLWRRLNWR